jgi:hypothetical protein
VTSCGLLWPPAQVTNDPPIAAHKAGINHDYTPVLASESDVATTAPAPDWHSTVIDHSWEDEDDVDTLPRSKAMTTCRMVAEKVERQSRSTLEETTVDLTTLASQGSDWEQDEGYDIGQSKCDSGKSSFSHSRQIVRPPAGRSGALTLTQHMLNSDAFNESNADIDSFIGSASLQARPSKPPSHHRAT